MNRPDFNRTRAPGARSLLRDGAALASLWLLMLICYWRIALAGRVLASGDVFTYFYPYWAEATRAVEAGRLPLWNPYLFMGAPFLANSQVGFFYPFNQLLWRLFPAHRSIHLTIVAHLGLAASFGYLWARASLRRGRAGAWTLGAILVLGGYLGAQVEHVNQLQGMAWFPLTLLLYDRSVCAADRRRSGAIKSCLALAIVVALILLAGHTQSAFISLVGLAIYGLLPSPACRSRAGLKGVLRRATVWLIATALGAMLAAAQLAPTWELSRFSIRAKGLPFNERVSFSLSPFYLGRALLPTFGETIPPAHIEYVAYVGLTGLALACVGGRRAWMAWRSRPDLRPDLRPDPRPYLLLSAGLFLALGRYNPLYLLLARFAPGFAHFRAPARWLWLYVVGMAAVAGQGTDALFQTRLTWEAGRRWLLLAGGLLLGLMGWAVVGARIDVSGATGSRVGWMTGLGWIATLALACVLFCISTPGFVQRLNSRMSRWGRVGLLVLLTLELLVASSALPHSRATAPQAFTDLRPAIAHLLADAVFEPTTASRFISMSDITFDPGDLGEINVIYGGAGGSPPQLSEAALYDYIVAVKQKEVLSPNVPLAFGVHAVDGYGGGVLPLARYVTLQRLFLDEDAVSMDGRLRENLRTIPDGRWLNLFGVRYVITDKLRDAWLDGVFYDLQFRAHLSAGETAAVAHVPAFKATALGLVWHWEGEKDAPSAGVPSGVVEVGFQGGVTQTFALNGERGEANGVTRLRWTPAMEPVAVTVRGAAAQGELVVQGVSLIDERTGDFQALTLSDQGRFRLVHSGDVKIYENLDVLPRPFFVHRAVRAGDDETALALMRDEAFDPAETVVLAAGEGALLAAESAGAGGQPSIRVLRDEPETIAVEVTSDAPGYLVLSDAWLPGWRASVDGEPAALQRANVLFRAVALEAGRHRVSFTYRPASLLWGRWVSILGIAIVALAWISRSASSHPTVC